MRHFAYLAALLLLSGAVALAQDSPQTSTSAPRGGKAAVKGPQKSAGAVEGDQATRAMTGCIEKNGDNYVFKNGHYKDGIMVHGNGDKDMAPYVGQTVRLSGTWATPGKDFNATKVSKVSDACNPKIAGSAHDKNTSETSTPPQ